MKRQRGVTLVELTVTLILIGIVIFVGISFSAQMSDIVKRQEAQLQEAAWKTVLDNIQKRHLKQLANGVITSPTGNLTLTDVGACEEAATNRTAVTSLLQDFVGGADARGLDSNPWAAGGVCALDRRLMLRYPAWLLSSGLWPFIRRRQWEY